MANRYKNNKDTIKINKKRVQDWHISTSVVIRIKNKLSVL